MKILYHHRTQAEDAQGVHISEMINAFRDLGHTVEVAALVTPGAPAGREQRPSRWHALQRLAPTWCYELLGLLYNFYGYALLRRAIKRAQPDLIYERYALNTVCGIWASRRFSIPLALEVNAPLYREQKALGRLAFPALARWTERWICSNASRTLVVSQAMKEILAEEGVPRSKMAVMPNAIDPHRFHPGVSAHAVIRRYDLQGQTVLGFVGWFRKWHGLETLLRVFHEARLWEKRAKLLLVGDGPAASDLEEYVRTNRLERYVVFAKAVSREEIASHIAAFDLALQPAVTEYASPMKLFEYMAMAKCVIAPDQPNIREIVEDGVTARLFRPNNPKSLADALIALIEAPDERKRLGARAREVVFERGHLWQKNAERTLELVLGGNSVRARLPSVKSEARENA